MTFLDQIRKPHFNIIDKIIGGGSVYHEKRLRTHGVEEKTYEDAYQEYESILYKDNKQDVFVYSPKYFSSYKISQKLERENYTDITDEYKNKEYIYFYKNDKEIKINTVDFE